MKTRKLNMMKMNSRIMTAMAAVLLCGGICSAQTVGFEQYIRSVAQNNAALLAERYNVDIADANLQAARVFNDPELSVEYGNNQDWDLMMGQSVDVGLEYSFSLGGLRKARIASALSEKQMTEAALDAYLCQLRAEASVAWAEAWKLRESCAILEESSVRMDKIAQSDSLRLVLGDLGSTDAAQSQLEANSLRNELIALRAEYRNALLALEYLAGGLRIGDIAGDALPAGSTLYPENEIFEIAEATRADLRAAQLSHKLSENNLALVKASRAMELGITAGYSFNTEVRNEIAPAPQFQGLSIGISIPLKLSSANRGEVRAAAGAVEQQRLFYESARQQVRTEVAQAYNSYLASREVLAKYDEAMLESARRILDSRQHGYEMGETSLIELLAARDTYAGVMKAYVEAQCNCYESEVLLQQAIGYFVM